MGNDIKEKEPGKEKLSPKERLDNVKKKMKQAESKGAQLTKRREQLVANRKLLEEKIKAHKKRIPDPETPVTRT